MEYRKIVVCNSLLLLADGTGGKDYSRMERGGGISTILVLGPGTERIFNKARPGAYYIVHCGKLVNFRSMCTV
jgi:hypothetical protein